MDEKAYFLAVKYLSYRPRSIREVTDYLKGKEISFELIDIVVKKLQEQKFLNDEEFARMWIRSRLVTKPKSKLILKMELKKKGISEEIITQSLEDMFISENTSDFQLAKVLAEKKWNKFDGLPREEIYRKLGGFLMRRGFSYDVVKRIIDEIFGK